MGTDAGSPPQVVFMGHHDGMRGRAGGNWAYIAQSYGASIHEMEMAEIDRSSSGCRRRWRMLRYIPIDEESRCR